MSYSRDIRIYPGRDERAANNGFTCAELMFVLTDQDAPGAATFALRTNWLPHSMEQGAIRPSASLRPMDLVYHFAVPTMTVAQDKRDICPYLDGPCHSITDRKAMPILLALLQAEGSDGVWPTLQKLFEIEARIQRPRIRGGT